MARQKNNKIGTAGAFGHDGQGEVGPRVRGRSVGGKLHRRGEGRKPIEAPTTVAQAVVVQIVKQETALEAKIVAGLKRANEMIQVARAAEADRALTAAAQARADICDIVHVRSPERRHALIAAAIIAHC